MNERESQLRLQAYLDGELGAKEAREVEAELAERRELGLLAQELRGVDQALLRAGDDLVLPESREFYWSKIESAIRRAEMAEVIKPRRTWFAQVRQWLMPAGALAGVALSLLLAVYSPSSSHPTLQASVADPAAFTYRDFNRGMTLVWLTYPADSENTFE